MKDPLEVWDEYAARAMSALLLSGKVYAAEIERAADLAAIAADRLLSHRGLRLSTLRSPESPTMKPADNEADDESKR